MQLNEYEEFEEYVPNFSQFNLSFYQNINMNNNMAKTTSYNIHNFILECNKPVYLPPLPIQITEETTWEFDETLIQGVNDSFQEGNNNPTEYTIFVKEDTATLIVGNLLNGQNSAILPNEEDHIDNKKRNIIWNVIYPEEFSLFTELKTKNEFIEEEFKKQEEIMLNKKRSRKGKKIQKRKKEKKDMVRRDISRDFLNKGLKKIIDNKLEKYFAFKFNSFSKPISLKISLSTKDEFRKMNIKEILESLKKKKKNDLYNLNLIKKLNEDENKKKMIALDLDIIFNMKFSDMLKEYFSSQEFVDVVNEVKKSKKGAEENYVGRYIYFSNVFMNDSPKKKGR